MKHYKTLAEVSKLEDLPTHPVRIGHAREFRNVRPRRERITLRTHRTAASR